MQYLVEWWIIRRYGVVHDLCPPLGWAPWHKPSMRYRLKYVALHTLWRVENAAFVRYGERIRESWRFERKTWVG